MPKKTDFLVIFDKIDIEKRIDFLLFSVISWKFFLAFETLKIVLPPARERNFHKIAFFGFDEKRGRKSVEKDMDFDEKLDAGT